MSMKTKIPAGYYRLRKGTKLKYGDKFLCSLGHWAETVYPNKARVGDPVTKYDDGKIAPYIRRKPKSRTNKPLT